MRVALAQINPTVGDLAGNIDRVVAAATAAHARGATLVVLPELALSGYPPLDLLDRPEFVADCEKALAETARRVPPLTVVVGHVERSGPPGRPVANAAAVIENGRVAFRYRKRLLPTYDVFDEDRHFEPGDRPVVFEHRGRRVGLTICEDLWTQGTEEGVRYQVDPMGDTVRAGADLVINLSASPFTLGKPERRTAMFGALAARHGTPLLFVNQVGGNDELVFDGHSTAFDAAGKVIRRAAGFAPDAPVIDPFAAGAEAPPFPTEEEAIHGALVLGLRDYAGKCGFAEAALGLSGGIDSAVAAVLATEALGPERVRGFAMPSRFSSEGSRTDARALADALGVRLDTISIEPVFETYLDTLSPLFEGRPFDVAEENLQARIRGAFLMAVSNKFGSLVLSTGNKSEIAVGYATLYGDMCGGLAPIGDLLKRRVYALARHLDGIRPRIPRATLDKPPSAELRPDQRDEDSLPPYDRLDRILQIHVEDGGDERALAAAGIDAATVERVLRMVRRAEHKRRQGPPVLKVTRKAFGRGRRLPIAADWRPPDGAPGERHGAPPTGR